MLKKISVVIIGVNNMGRAINFYKNILALPLKFEAVDYSEFKTLGAVLALEKRSKIIVGNGPVFTFESKNIKTDLKNLQKKKVKIWQDLKEENFGWLLMPKDSEGNIFEIVQYK